MMDITQWADRGQRLQTRAGDAPQAALPAPVAPAPAAAAGQVSFLGVARLGSAQLEGGFSIWLQVRGTAWVEAREGRFQLRRGDWIAFEKDSRPSVQTDRHGLCLGLHLGAPALRALANSNDVALYAGRGRMSARDLRLALRLWREASKRATTTDTAPVADTALLRPLLLHLAGVQHALDEQITRCPGRSRNRKRQVFGRLQRARLYLEGNSDRVVRISELAELTSFSNWYFSKTFQSLYEESPQSAAARMRVERAAHLLDSTTMLIGDVAAACGFDNCCSFARAFRARFGVSASHYRKAAANSDLGADTASGRAAARTAAATLASVRETALRTGT